MAHEFNLRQTIGLIPFVGQCISNPWFATSMSMNRDPIKKIALFIPGINNLISGCMSAAVAWKTNKGWIKPVKFLAGFLVGATFGLEHGLDFSVPESVHKGSKELFSKKVYTGLTAKTEAEPQGLAQRFVQRLAQCWPKANELAKPRNPSYVPTTFLNTEKYVSSSKHKINDSYRVKRSQPETRPQSYKPVQCQPAAPGLFVRFCGLFARTPNRTSSSATKTSSIDFQKHCIGGSPRQ